MANWHEFLEQEAERLQTEIRSYRREVNLWTARLLSAEEGLREVRKHSQFGTCAECETQREEAERVSRT